MSAVPSAVLFACTYNAVRSPMALSIFRHLFGDRAYGESVGVEVGALTGFASAVLEEAGFPTLENHQPQTFDDLHDDNFEVIVALSQPAYERALEETRTMACEVLYWPIEDPSGVEGNREARLDAYRHVRDALMDHMRKEWIEAPASVSKDKATRKPKSARVKEQGHVLWNRMRNRLKKLRG